MTPVRSIPSDFDPAVVAAIQQRLRRIEAEQRVTIVWAVESGSRAWGFPSPDSDYDCRFIFIRPLADYLSVEPKRDVIEVPIEEDLDIVGWDLFKMAKLLLKGNAVAIEWLTSPIIYCGFDAFRSDWTRQADLLVDRPALIKHYLGLGSGQLQKHWSDREEIALKKIFYVLRPAVALRWLRMNAENSVAPMHFPTLIAQTDIPADTRREIDSLLMRKAETREMGQGTLPESIAALVHSEYELARSQIESAEMLAGRRTREIASIDGLIRQWLGNGRELRDIILQD